MLYRLEKLIGMSISATNGDVGKVKDVFFDAQYWAVRYLVIDTGGWLSGRQVLISPFTIEGVNHDERLIHVRLSKEQIEGSPSIDSQMPVSRQHEVDLGNHYGYPEYWSGLLLWGEMAYPLIPTVDQAYAADADIESEVDRGDPNLHNVKTVHGYHIQATDDSIGHLEDFLIEDESWAIRYIVVDTRNWWIGKHVVIPPQWIKQVDWAERTVSVDVTRAAVQGAPEYDPTIDVSRIYEQDFYRYYQRPFYW